MTYQHAYKWCVLGLMSIKSDQNDRLAHTNDQSCGCDVIDNLQQCSDCRVQIESNALERLIDPLTSETETSHVLEGYCLRPTFTGALLVRILVHPIS